MNTKSHQIGRRQFLIASSAAVASVAVVPKLFAAVVAEAPKRIVVGFAPFDESVAAMDAMAIPAGDGNFISRGARVSVSGARKETQNPSERRAVELLAHYSVMDGADRTNIPFRAWACSRANGCQGSSVSFAMPVDEVQKLVFSVETERGLPSGTPASRRDAFTAPTESATTPITFSLTSEAGTIKLVRGFYVIVPIFEGDSDPRWSAYTVKSTDKGYALVDRDGNAANFEHFILRIDYAAEL